MIPMNETRLAHRQLISNNQAVRSLLAFAEGRTVESGLDFEMNEGSSFDDSDLVISVAIAPIDIKLEVDVGVGGGGELAVKDK